MIRPLRPEVARKFLEPQSVAIVGVSTSSSQAYKAGGRAVLDHLGVYGYGGNVYVVHPTATEVDGRPVFPALANLPEVPDVVVLAVPAKSALGVLEQCAQIGVRQVLVLTAGFGDMGAEGLALERNLLEFAGQHEIAIVGPNSTGLVNVRTGLAMSMTSVLTEGEPIAAGGLAMIAQSGAIGSTVVERARLAGVGISHIVSTGNQRDMDIPDFVSFFARNADVETVALYVESIRDGARFAAAVEELTAAGKRLVAYLGGRTDAGEQAAASHTGKIVGRGALELALLRALGVTVVDDPDDLWVLGTAEVPTGSFPRRWGMVAYSGGMAVLATEQLAAAGVTFPKLSDQTLSRVQERSPQFVAAHNPLDVGPGSMPHDFRAYLSAVAADPAVEAICVPLPMGARGWNQQSVDDVLTVRKESGKPFVVLWYGGLALRPYVEQLRSQGVLVAEKPSDLGRLVSAMLGPERELSSSRTPSFGPSEPVDAALGGADALLSLERAGLDVVPMRVCVDAEGAIKAAAEIGYPVVLKSGAAEVAHRLELGLVRVGLANEAVLTEAYSEMVARATAAGLPGEGPWLVQQMAAGRVELVLTVRDAGELGVFGSVGLGGAAVEILRDVESVPLPCDLSTLDRALRRLRTAELMFGYRGSAPVSTEWVHRALHRLADVLRRDALAEIEVNPALVGPDGGVIVDALSVARRP
ncbi:acetate--CoA ligase family protein [Sporichthya brevicatena]|uniref:Acetate--CoA ligase family protein n=1 Tax=Sporichthya brevicatena TaxID=171442 RepID=A0ABN1GIZ1_9ACTN